MKSNLFTNLINIGGIILLKLLLDFSYVYFISPIFGYDGFTLDFHLDNYIEGWIAYLVLYIILKKNQNNILYITLLISFLLLIPPTTTLYAFKGENSFSFYVIIVSYGFLLSLITTKKIELIFIKNTKLLGIVLSFCATVIVLGHYILVVGLTNINFDISKVYGIRGEFGVLSNEGLFGYLNGWTIKVFNIFLITWSIHSRKFKLFFLFVLFQMILFGLSGHKTVLFVLFIVGGIYVLDKYKNFSTILIYGTSSIIGLLLIYYFSTNELQLPSTLIRRAFFVPANLNYVYLDFFSDHEYVYWSNSILKSFIHYPYDEPITNVIGGYLGYPDMGANTGIIGSGYMQMGILGIFIYIVLMSFFINLINSFDKLPKWLINSIVLMPILTAFIGSDLLTTFLTHGFLISIIILYLYSSNQQILKLDKYETRI